MLALTPVFVGWHQPFQTFRYREMKRAIHLRTLSRIVSASDSDRVIVLDEGPVYLLARQLVLGAAALDNAAFARWWHRTLDHWARALRLVVWLDADSACLAERIRQRPGRPPIPDVMVDDALLLFLERYRAAYDRVLGRLSQQRGAAVLSIDTGSHVPAAIAERVLMEIGRPAPAHD